jgi:glycosyltransferase involved in cell wall biosynthesis
MKIAVVLNTSWNIYNFRLNLIKALFNEGHEVVAIAPKDEYTSKLIEVGCQYEEIKMDSRGVNPLKDLALTYELYKIYRRVKPDVILQYTIKPNIYGTIAASRLKIPVINNVCGLGTAFLKDNLFSKVAIALYKFAFRFPKLIYFQNDEDKKFFIESKIVSEDKIDVLPGSGIDLKRFVPVVQEERNEKPFTFLLISRLIHDKGIIEYIEATKLLRARGVKARFELLGQIDEKHLRAIPRKLVDRWTEEGLVDYLGTTDDVRPYINDSDCVVLPSYREGTPKSLIEAASAAKPIVATDVAGCNNIVEDKVNGFLCQRKDQVDLADKMESMYNADVTERAAMGAAGRKIAEARFDEKIVIDKYLSAINTV